MNKDVKHGVGTGPCARPMVDRVSAQLKADTCFADGCFIGFKDNKINSLGYDVLLIVIAIPLNLMSA